MVQEFRKGLASDNEMIKMIPSFVVSLPSGSEQGRVLALDMGGSNFRVIEACLEGSGRVRTKQRKFAISDEFKRAPGRKLFDFFADCVSNFIRDEKISGEALPLGFTFSFPVHQTAINSGRLITWTKGFENEGVVGEDVVSLLEDSFKRKNVDVNVVALVNDTVGTLVTHAYKDSQTFISLILGTGTNAAYVEKVSEVPKWYNTDTGFVVINTEWGNYGDPTILPFSKYDKMVDRASENPKKQVFEKMISGLYLGEITRYMILDLVSSGDLFKGMKSALIDEPHSFVTAYMSRIERDHSLDLTDTKSVLEDVMGIPATSFNDRRIVKHMCELVGTRAARLAAAGVAALVTKINRLDACTVAIDGSLYEHYPHFGNRMRDALRELLGITAENVVLELAHDGSGLGAALIAATH